MLIAIMLHKGLVAFSLGLELASSIAHHHRYRPAVLLFIFSIISPIGIGIGMAITSGHVDELAQTLASGVLQALATGTFLYVTFFEILGQSFGHSHGEGGFRPWAELLKVVLTFVGFGAMGAATLLESD